MSGKRKFERVQESGRESSITNAPSLFLHCDYTVGWISALPLEMTAARLMLDAIHPKLHNPSNDDNSYISGRIGDHNVVIACMPSGVYGMTSATEVATKMRSSFPSICFGLLVGVGGGAPRSGADIRLGDIVVSKPERNHSGVVQYDYGKTVQGGDFNRTGMLNKPPRILLNAIAMLESQHDTRDSRIPEYLMEIAGKYPAMPEFARPPHHTDQLFEADYEHVDSENNCNKCDESRLVLRNSRVGNNPVIHYGLIASANQVMKHAATRDRLSRELGILCFEMEAGGLMDDFPCLVIRGICDYADSHKSREWQKYAATTAAAFGKELLSVTPTQMHTAALHLSLERRLGQQLMGWQLATINRRDHQALQCLSESPTKHRGPPVERLERSDSLIAYRDQNYTQNSTRQVPTRDKPDLYSDPSCVEPASSFERSPRFRPASYTSRSRIPEVIITYYYEKSWSESARINCYRVLYFHSTEDCVDINVALEIPRQSIYSNITRVTTAYQTNGLYHGLVSPYCIPMSLLESLQVALKQFGTIRQHDRFKFRLANEDQKRVQLETLETPKSYPANSIGSAALASSKYIGRDILALTRQWGCEMYPEGEVLPLAPLEYPYRLIANFEDALVEEVKLPYRPDSEFPYQHDPNFCYNIEALHRLRCVSGFGRLVGVVTDKAKQQFKSYLVQWLTSKTTCELLLHRASKLSPHCSWKQIENWARQLITRISDVHSKCLVVGTLWYQRPPILVDAAEQLYLWRFETRIMPSSTAFPFYPPELHHYTRIQGMDSKRDEHPMVTPQLDIYQLGTLLWILATAFDAGETALFVKEQLYRDYECRQNGHRARYPAPPCLPETIPKHYRDVVDACYIADPHYRLSAKELLLKFPPVDISQRVDVKFTPIDISAMQKCRVRSHCCSRCWKQILSVQYKCTICDESDFDLCPTCFDKGRHCEDVEHLLVKVEIQGNFPAETEYWSCADSSGRRNVIKR